LVANLLLLLKLVGRKVELLGGEGLGKGLRRQGLELVLRELGEVESWDWRLSAYLLLEDLLLSLVQERRKVLLRGRPLLGELRLLSCLGVVWLGWRGLLDRQRLLLFFFLLRAQTQQLVQIQHRVLVCFLHHQLVPHRQHLLQRFVHQILV